MKNPKVISINTRRPNPNGRRMIVFSHGKREQTAVIKSPTDWNVSAAVDNSLDPMKVFCVCVSPDGDGVIVYRWEPNKVASRIELDASDIGVRLGGDPREMETNDIVEEVRGDLN